NEIPRLHESHRRGVMRCLQDSRQRRFRQRVAFETTAVAPLKHRPIKAGLFSFRKIVTHYVSLGDQKNRNRREQRKQTNLFLTPVISIFSCYISVSNSAAYQPEA